MPAVKQASQKGKRPTVAQRAQAAAEASPRSSVPASGTDTVTVGCKLPSGFVMRVFEMRAVQFPIVGMPGQFREEVLPQQVGPSHRIAGSAIAVGQAPRALIVGGYAITTGVPRELAEEWFRQNAKSAMVREGIVFMREEATEAQDQAREQADVRSGLEPLDPGQDMVSERGKIVPKPRDYRWPKRTRSELTVVASDVRE